MVKSGGISMEEAFEALRQGEISMEVCPPTDMGRRKSKRKPPPKKKMTGTLETQFTCPFCNHEKSCDVKMDRARNTGVISCTVCLEEFQTPITCILGKPGFFRKAPLLITTELMLVTKRRRDH
uniref:transcription elongation factor 1 homolog isoform X1 n=2 Tax=Halichoerus grypus TaxID=9711 RepID=UPI001659ABBE|nr:transcription elongation factor 1 homolog isoform X1 [Halichoerus grypus]